MVNVALGPASHVPAYAAAENGSDGWPRMDMEPVDCIPRPSILECVKSAYVLIIADNSMAPAYGAGDWALANPKLGRPNGTDGRLVTAGESSRVTWS